jgi:hypothetical protein
MSASMKSNDVINVPKTLIDKLANTYGFNYEAELQKYIAEIANESKPVIEQPLVDKNKIMNRVMDIINASRISAQEIRLQTSSPIVKKTSKKC